METSQAPCPFCGEFFEIRHPQQTRHVQSEWCYKRARNTSASRVKRNAFRLVKKQNKPLGKCIRKLSNPYGYAIQQTRRWGFSWLLQRFPEDVKQELFLVLLEAGIEDISAPVVLDIAALSRSISSHLYAMATAYGFRHGRDKLPELSADNLLDRSIGTLRPHTRDEWVTAWKVA
jgi:hypothetical protein